MLQNESYVTRIKSGSEAEGDKKMTGCNVTKIKLRNIEQNKAEMLRK